MGELTLAVLGESLMSHVPRFVFIRPGDDSDADTGIESGIRRLLDALVGGLWILDGGRANRLSRRQSCLRRAGDEDSGKGLRRQRWRQPQIVHRVELSGKGDRVRGCYQLLDDQRGFDQPLVSLVV